MKKLHRIVAKHNKFKSIPVHTFYFSNNKDLSKYRLVLDTPEDLERMKTIMDSMTKPHSEYSMDELIEIYPSA